MRTISALSIAVLLMCSCKDPKTDGSSNGVDSVAQHTNIPETTEVGGITLTSLEGSGLRFNGIYRNDMGGITQVMRFFPRGTVVTANDRTTNADSLSRYLKEDLKPNIGVGLHNVPVTLRNDSILIHTTIISGYISYAGALHGLDTIMFLKSSSKGKRVIIPYYFVEDK